LKEFVVNIIGLSNKEHLFDYHIDDAFFTQYGNEVISKGDFEVKVSLNKRETFIEVDFKIKGFTRLVCDLSLDSFDYKMDFDRKVIFKYGEEPQEISDEIVIITRDQESLDLGQFIYEFILLEVPMKKVKPELQQEEDSDEDGRIIYSTTEPEEKKSMDVDPRWEKLKNLKK
jgi:uncharacterized metal-binding protein YceD (DUF177 family)